MRVLIADDDPIIRLDICQLLKKMGYDVVADASDGVEAVEQARTLRPDVCVLDVKMPNLDGIDAADQIAADGISPVILLTAYSDRELVERAKTAGVYGYLVKPFKPGDLQPAIEVARSRFEQHQVLMNEVANIEERLAVRKMLDRAKGLLMDRERLTEADAYRLIQQRSMNLRKSMREVASAVIAEYDPDTDLAPND